MGNILNKQKEEVIVMEEIKDKGMKYIMWS
jgi:hypothetical protein